MPSLAELDSAAHVVAQGSEATALGNTPFASETRNTKPDPRSLQSLTPKLKALFHSLPDEIHLNILAQLWRDPVSQICFGLTARRFYALFHDVLDKGLLYDGAGKVYEIKRYPFDLRMRAAIDESHVLYGWYEYGYMLGATCVEWQRSLGELLWDEEWLWTGLRCCFECMKYKPEEAFGGFELEKKLEKEDSMAWRMSQEREASSYRKCCRRCRAKSLLVNLGGREEVVEVQGNAFEERASLGLIRCGEERRSRELWTKMNCYYYEDGDILETWDEVFAKMGL
ncbi:hypothetical protein ONS95_003140 [Cadophora gregata]|uniref:uncharacterized protein n=1 Tax=Cadophora gregata TaxID=51156 RepID=UPI0026DC2F1F|nr:uncharacterized protein ONS95_003140 [Cadophora gregata]KAK0108325.1 hypothetical protein ONS95_003140 [Cadophora gregata]KAK0109084.1 hypothetical protein ONS96_002913 [Cadophora gregata f. sp. sojae]